MKRAFLRYGVPAAFGALLGALLGWTSAPAIAPILSGVCAGLAVLIVSDLEDPLS